MCTIHSLNISILKEFVVQVCVYCVAIGTHHHNLSVFAERVLHDTLGCYEILLFTFEGCRGINSLIKCKPCHHKNLQLSKTGTP